jgi:CRP-like cAMP-binding protein
MKNNSAEPLPDSSTQPLRAGTGALPLSSPAQPRSSRASGNVSLLGNLRPSFLEGLPPDEVKSLLAVAKHRRASANSVLTRQEDPARHLFLLLTGRARYFFVTERGQKVILLWIPPGEIFGSAALLPAPTGYHVCTETVRNSSMLVWERATIRNLAERCPRLFENALYQTVQYLAAYRAAHRALICDTAQERLAHVLVSLANGIGENAEGGVELKIRNEELANEANITLFTASRLLNEWQRAGLLRKGRGKILLRDPERLLRHAA